MKQSTGTFTLNGKTYTTDQQTLAVLRRLIPSAYQTADSSDVIAVMVLGQSTGRITEVIAEEN
jgi:hypothetical protein